LRAPPQPSRYDTPLQSGAPQKTLEAGRVQVQQQFADPRWADDSCLANMPAHVRSEFVMKVYMILATQALLTTMIANFFAHGVERSWLLGHCWMANMASIGTLALLVGGAFCVKEQLRFFPLNFSFLILLTLLNGITVGFATNLYALPGALIAAGSTAAIFTGLMMFACVTRTDFAGVGPYAFTAFFGLMSVGCVIVFNHTERLQGLLGGLIATIIVAAFIFHTKRIVAEIDRPEIGVDDFVFAAISLCLKVTTFSGFIAVR